MAELFFRSAIFFMKTLFLIDFFPIFIWTAFCRIRRFFSPLCFVILLPAASGVRQEGMMYKDRNRNSSGKSLRKTTAPFEPASKNVICWFPEERCRPEMKWVRLA
jgi:hypothetical protein